MLLVVAVEDVGESPAGEAGPTEAWTPASCILLVVPVDVDVEDAMVVAYW